MRAEYGAGARISAAKEVETGLSISFKSAWIS